MKQMHGMTTAACDPWRNPPKCSIHGSLWPVTEHLVRIVHYISMLTKENFVKL